MKILCNENNPVFVRRNGEYMLVPFCKLLLGDYIVGSSSYVGCVPHESGDSTYDGWVLYDYSGESIFPQDVCLFNPDEVELFAKDLWDNDFGAVPMNPDTECIEAPWLHFPTGTHREEIWHWFENTFSVRVHDLMYGGSE